MKKSPTSSRKQQHVALTVKSNVSFRAKSAGFDHWDFVHQALPEINASDVSTFTTFLGKPLRLPLIISSMTGGYRDATRINRLLAELCVEQGLAMGVGSQRQALEHAAYHRSFSIVREVSKEIPVFGNIGAAEVAKLKDAGPVQKLVDLIKADGFAVHLNPLQELLQPEGNPHFRGVLAGIELLVRNLSVPVIVKEIGAGISQETAKKLLGVGVSIIDVAGAGGTSWAGVEIMRSKKKENENPLSMLWDWGIPTIDSLREVAVLKKKHRSLYLIGSGGVNSGLDIAKAIALGADATGSARPILRTLELRGKRSALSLIDDWEKQLRAAMFLTGSATIKDLQQQRLMERNNS